MAGCVVFQACQYHLQRTHKHCYRNYRYNTKQDLKHALSLPALSNVHPLSDTAREVTVEKCFSRTAKHFLLFLSVSEFRFHTLTVASSLPENSWNVSEITKVKEKAMPHIQSTKDAVEKKLSSDFGGDIIGFTNTFGCGSFVGKFSYNLLHVYASVGCAILKRHRYSTILLNGFYCKAVNLQSCWLR